MFTVFQTKLGIKMRPYTAYLCAKFQGTQITHFHLMATLTPWQKEEENKEKLSQFLKVYISEMPDMILLQFGMWDTDGEGSSTAKIVQFHKNSTKVHICENCIIVFPVNILTNVECQLLGLHYTLLCSGVTRNMVIPGPVFEVVGDHSSGGLGAVPPDSEKGLIFHVLRMA